MSQQRGDVLHQVRSAAAAQGHQLRRIVLTPGWWTREGPDLTVTRGKQLLRTHWVKRGYHLEDPDHTEVKGQRIDATIAATLGPDALLVVPPVNQARGLRALVGIGFVGSRRDGLLIALSAVAGGILGLSVPLAAGVLFGAVVPGAQTERLGGIIAALALVSVALVVAAYGRGISLTRIRTRFDRQASISLWQHVLSLPVSFFAGFSTGSLTARVTSVSQVRQLVSSQIVTAAFTGAVALVNLVLLWAAGPTLGFLATMLVVAEIVVVLLLTRSQRASTRAAIRAQNEVQGFTLQAIQGIETIRLTGAEQRFLAMWRRRFIAQVQARKEALITSGRIATVVLAWTTAGALLVTAVATSQGTIDAGGFMVLISALTLALAGVAGFSSALSVMVAIAPIADQVAPLLSASPEQLPTGRLTPTLLGAVALDRVTFTYPGQPAPAITEVSIQVEPGEMIAIVGPSGAGKSTLLRLLLGFDEPDLGTVTYDGTDIAQLDRRSLRRQIGTVLQSVELMPGPVGMNIAASAPLTRDEIWRAARLAGIEDDIRSWPMQLDTVLGSSMSISGGQRQRLVIARALARDPRVLLFDEATSALDNMTQKEVSDAIAALNVTRIIIAHRLSTVMGADRIYVMDHGRLVQQGTYDDLVRRPGLFRKLAERQLTEIPALEPEDQAASEG